MKLKKLYELLPEIQCEEGCTDCCAPVYMLRSEAAKMGIKDTFTKWGENFKCEFLSPEGCSNYENRPWLCRAFGCSEFGILSCKKVKGKLLSEEEMNRLFSFYAEIITESNTTVTQEFVEIMFQHDVMLEETGKSPTRLKPGQSLADIYQEKYSR